MLPPASPTTKSSSRAPAGVDYLLAFEAEAVDASPGAAPNRPPRKGLLPSPAPVVARRPSVAAAVAIGAALIVAAAAWSTRSFGGADSSATPDGARMASLSVITRPQGAQVLIDDQPRGVTPLAIDIPPGKHTLTVRSGAAEKVMAIDVSPGADILRDLDMTPPLPSEARTASSNAAEQPPAHAAAGWIAITAPFELQVRERGDVIGTSAARRIMVPSGRRTLLLVNPVYEFEQRRTVDVEPGQTAALRVQVAPVSIEIDAVPSADVSIDGKSVGQTPITDLTLSVGVHRFVFRHPDLGERHEDVVITSRAAQRVFIDLTQ